MQIIPAIDVLDGRIVRLQKGDYKQVTDFGDNILSVAKIFESQGAKILHLVNLSGAKNGQISSTFLHIVETLSNETDFDIQVGGGIRSLQDIAQLMNAGASKVVISTLIYKNPDIVGEAILLYGSHRIIAALDCLVGIVQIAGWAEGTDQNIECAVQKVIELGIQEILVTDIESDGMGNGPNVELYRKIAQQYPSIRIIASGGIRNQTDLDLLNTACEAAVIGRALLSGEVSYRNLCRQSNLAIRIIPCLDIANGRTVKGTKFQDLQDAGDPVELAKKYCNEGADELVFLDIHATNENRGTTYDLVFKVANAINIPFTIGGGVRSVDDAQRLLQAGADKVAVNSAAVQNPDLLSAIAKQLGSANTVCAIDARKKGNSWVVLTNGGQEETTIDAIEWSAEAVNLGAGELLVTSYDRDGTGNGFDTELLASIKKRVHVPIIASGGAGTLEDFAGAIVHGNADGLLAASIFHFNTFSISDVKTFLSNSSFPIRL